MSKKNNPTKEVAQKATTNAISKFDTDELLRLALNIDNNSLIDVKVEYSDRKRFSPASPQITEMHNNLSIIDGFNVTEVTPIIYGGLFLSPTKVMKEKHEKLLGTYNAYNALDKEEKLKQSRKATGKKDLKKAIILDKPILLDRLLITYACKVDSALSIIPCVQYKVEQSTFMDKLRPLLLTSEVTEDTVTHYDINISEVVPFNLETKLTDISDPKVDNFLEKLSSQEPAKQVLKLELYLDMNEEDSTLSSYAINAYKKRIAELTEKIIKDLDEK